MDYREQSTDCWASNWLKFAGLHFHYLDVCIWGNHLWTWCTVKTPSGTYGDNAEIRGGIFFNSTSIFFALTPSIIHGLDGFNWPQGPWDMNLDTSSCRTGCVSGSGMSARMMLSMSSGVRILSSYNTVSMWRIYHCFPRQHHTFLKLMSRCACGRPRFWYSITCTCALTEPKIPLWYRSLQMFFNFMWKTRQMMSGRSDADWPGSRESEEISVRIFVHFI